MSQTVMTATASIGDFLRTLFVLVMFAVLTTASNQVDAADGYYDPGFGNGGYRAFDVSNGSGDSGRILRVLGNGRILMAGTCLTGTGARQFCVARLNADGSFDTSFGPGGPGGVGGYVRFDLFQTPAGFWLKDMIVLADGNIALVGDDSNQLLLAILNTGGTALVPGLGSPQGWNTILLNGSTHANRLLQQPDGKLLIAGSTLGLLGNLDMMVLRMNPDRTGDGSFGSGGVAQVAFDLGGPSGLNADTARAIALQPDGKIVLAGDALASNSLTGQYAALARLLPNGVRDPAFGSDGRLQLAFNSSFHALALDRSGVIIAGGAALDGTTGSFLVSRFAANGGTAPGTGTTVFHRTTGDVGAIEDILVRASGDFLITGFAAVNGYVAGSPESYVVCARFLADGWMDASFGIGGKSYGGFATADPNNRNDYRNDGYRIALGSGGILIGGLSKKSSATRARFGVMKLQFDAIFDDGFQIP